MAQQTINAGPPYSGAGDLLAVGWQKANANFNEIYALQSQTINAGALAYDSPTVEGRIALADADAASRGFPRLYIPASLLPYNISLCPPSAGVQRIREGGDSSVYDVWAYGAAGDFVQDDTAQIQAAITAASTAPGALQGGVVYFPAGTYKTTSGLTVPIALNQNQVILRGAGMRVAYIRPSGDSANFTTPIILFGTTTPDASGTTTNNTQYCGMDHLNITGASLTGVTPVIAVQMTQMQRGWANFGIIENFTIPGSMGLYLRGSTTVGIGASAAPHTWRCSFDHLTVATTARPLVIENGDENDFKSCNWGLPTGLTSGNNYAVDIIQGHNNHFFGGLCSGDTNVVNRPNYWAIRLRNPTKGDVSGVDGYGMTAEGFDVGIYIESSTVHSVNFPEFVSSINRAAFNNGSDDGAASGERGNNVEITTTGTTNIRYRAGRGDGSEPVTITGATPSVVKSNSLICGNSGATTITQFLNGRLGQLLYVRLDANTTIQHGTGVDNIRCPGAANITPAAHRMVTMVYVGGLWEVTSVVTDA